MKFCIYWGRADAPRPTLKDMQNKIQWQTSYIGDSKQNSNTKYRTSPDENFPWCCWDVTSATDWVWSRFCTLQQVFLAGKPAEKFLAFLVINIISWGSSYGRKVKVVFPVGVVDSMDSARLNPHLALTSWGYKQGWKTTMSGSSPLHEPGSSTSCAFYKEGPDSKLSL